MEILKVRKGSMIVMKGVKGRNLYYLKGKAHTYFFGYSHLLLIMYMLGGNFYVTSLKLGGVA